jgi:pyrophosphatase PpaX
MPSSPYAAYLFDLDGVLVDTRDWIREAYRHTAARYGFDASDDLLSDLYGQPLQTCYRILHPGEDVELLMKCHREFQRDRMELQSLFPGVHETLERLRSRGGRIALISARTGTSQQATLALFGLDRWLDCVIPPEDCQAHKPEPEPVFRALEELNVAAAQALVIGDTPNDIRAGRAAGADTAGATYGFIGDAVAAARPLFLIDDIRQIPDLAPQSRANPFSSQAGFE